MFSICVFTPVYNSEDLIDVTIESIISQNKELNFSIYYCICDGGSTDKTLDIIKSKKNKLEKNNIKLFLISEKDNGMYDALSKGMQLMGNKYNYYCYINAGDYFSNYAFNTIIEFMSNSKINWLTGLTTIYNKSGKIISSTLPRYYDRQLIRQGFYGDSFNHIQQESTFWSCHAQEKIDLNILKKYRYAGDYYIWNTFAKFYDLHILKCWLGGFRIHENQLSVEYYNDYLLEFRSIKTRKNISTYIRLLALYLMRVRFLKYFFKKNLSTIHDLD